MRIFISLTCLALLAAPAPPARAQAPEAPGQAQSGVPADIPPGPETQAGAEPPAADPPALVVPAGNQSLEALVWVARPLVIFADSPLDPRFVQQMQNIAAEPDPLIARDVVVIVDTDPAGESPIRQALRPRGFALVLIGKDGQIYLRKPFPWHVREIIRSIDKMPIRQQEMADTRLVTNP